MLGELKRKLAGWREGLRTKRKLEEMHAVLAADSAEYREYLEVQLNRTLLKRGNALPPRAMHFTAAVSAAVPLAGKRVLCIGCRNINEIARFRDMGASEVVGVDLQSDDPAILVMDMHRLRFEDKTFDLVYSSHSLEHALRPDQAVAEIARVLKPGGAVAIEVPVQYQTRGADLQDYRSLEGLDALFGKQARKSIWSETCAPGEAHSFEPQSVVRAIFILE